MNKQEQARPFFKTEKNNSVTTLSASPKPVSKPTGAMAGRKEGGRRAMEDLAREMMSLQQEIKNTQRPLGTERFQILILSRLQQLANIMQVVLADE